MKKYPQKIELLAPAGNFEKLKTAVFYGANAVYAGGKDFSLRNFSGNFTIEELEEAVVFAHKNGAKLYVACNIYSRNQEQKSITKYFEKINEIKPDAVIIADTGIFYEAKRILNEIPIHISTQANTTNYRTANFWQDMGAKRINTARELSLKEIKEISEKSSIEIESFVHGAMCISYSGRCLLSAFMIQRSTNSGMCAHPCRWEYAVVERLRPGQYMPVAEDNRGTYMFNSKDMCMIEHIPEMINSGIDSLKIEGRMKGINYTATTVKVYREAIDSFYSDPDNYYVKKEWIRELSLLNNRGYCTGFYFNNPEEILPTFSAAGSETAHRFIGKIVEERGNGKVKAAVFNKTVKGNAVEILKRKGNSQEDIINNITDENGISLSEVQAGNIVAFEMNRDYKTGEIIRKNI